MFWFRHHHGTATDPKWLVVAAKAHTTPGFVFMVWCGLYEHASKARSRGSVSGFDIVSMAVFWAVPEDAIAATIAQLRALNHITSDDRIAVWETEQRKQDKSAGRMAKSRAKKRGVTDSDASHVRVTESDEHRGEKSEALRSVASSSVALPTIPLSPSTRADACAPEAGGKSRGGRFIDRVKAALTGEPAVEVNHARR